MLAACSKKKTAAQSIHFAPGELHLDKEEIVNSPPVDVRRKAFGVIYDLFKARNIDDWSSAAKALPQPWRALYTSSELDGEVKNDGFHQYFFNTRCKLLRETLDDLRYLGATEFADIHEKALSGIDVAYYTSSKRDDDDWDKFTSKYADRQWDDLEKRFYALKPEIDEIAAQHIKAHPEEYQ
jgi:Domain of unknown function (DUF4375)